MLRGVELRGVEPAGRRGSLALIVLAAVALFTPRSLHALAGVGLKAVEGVLGQRPESLEELRAAIQEADAVLATSPDDVAANYRRALLMLNDTEGLKTAAVRAFLGRVIAQDPAYKDAFAVWDALIPLGAELDAAAEALGQRGDAAALYAKGWIALRRGDEGQSAELAARARALDPALAARSLWLEAVAAFEEKRDEKGTELFAAAAADPDEEAVRLMFQSLSYAATPEELTAYAGFEVGERGEWIRSFWRRRDVFPLTATNERLGEHQRRLRQAREDYALETNGEGYLTLRKAFKELSPDLPHYSSDIVADYVEKHDVWFDHRGLVFVRHGKPDIANRAGISGARSETWLYYRNTGTPMLFHFVERLGVNENVLTLNLAQAALNTRYEDTPVDLLFKTRDFKPLYQRRGNMHRLFLSIATSRSRFELESLLVQESQLMAGFLKQVWLDDTSSLLERDDRLPFAASSASFAAEGGKSDLYVYYAIPENELDFEAETLSFEASMVLYTSDWLHEVATAQHGFSYQRPAGKRDKKKENLLVGVLRLDGLEPGNYRYAFQIREQTSGKLGVSKGSESVAFFGKAWVDLSDLVIADAVEPAGDESIFERHGHRVVPIPTRIVKRQAPIKMYYEIYDLEPDAAGEARFDVDYRILKIQGEQGVLSKVFGISMNVAGAFFPYYTFLTRAGLFGLDLLTTNGDEGLISLDEEQSAPASPVVARSYELDPRQYDKGVYQFYVTVTDRANGSIDTRSVRFAITD